jgi:hypothetical protein
MLGQSVSFTSSCAAAGHSHLWAAFNPPLSAAGLLAGSTYPADASGVEAIMDGQPSEDQGRYLSGELTYFMAAGISSLKSTIQTQK